jgi:hypothetical protein
MKNFTAIVISVFLLPLLFCNNPNAGGSDETQTGNRISGCLVDYRDGQPANNASVRLYHGETARPADTALDSTVTDTRGRYVFDSIDPGVYNIEGRKVDGTDTLSAMHRRIRHDTLTITDVGRDTLKAPGKISGSVDFNSSNKMGVTVFVPGTSFIAITDNSGAFCISYVPPDTYEVAYSYYGYLTAYDSAVVVHANTTTFLPVKHLVRDPSVPPPAPTGLRALYDTLMGIVTISWNDLRDSTVAGYIVFRKDTTRPADEPTQITGPLLVTDTVYCDTPYNSISDTNPYVFRYYVKSQDTNGNRSIIYSQPVMVTVYPYLPSMPQPADGATDQPINLTLSWHGVKAAPVVYSVFLDTSASPLALVYNGTDTSATLSTALELGKTYYWYVTASVGADTVRGPEWYFATIVPPTIDPPVITTQPQSQTLFQGQSTGFTVAVSGTAPFTYQWQKNGSDLSGETSALLLIPFVHDTDAGTYAVIVSNAGGSVTSDPASLTVNALGLPDPLWMFTDSVPVRFSSFRYCDTLRSGGYMCYSLESGQFPDTGSYDGSRYLNFDYQFTQDSAYMLQAHYPCLNPYDTCGADTLYRDVPRPGYAGFKTTWDYGMTGFPLALYKYLVLAHKGPLPNHKVTIRFWYNDGTCGAPSYMDSIGTLAASSTWKVDTIPIPESIHNRPASVKNYSIYYEMVVLINNLNPNDTTSGPPGNLKIDNIRLVGFNP